MIRRKILLVYRRKNSFSKALFLVFLVVILVLCIFIYNSKSFERDEPNIIIGENIYWNLKEPLKIEVSDESGIKFVRATLNDGENSITLINEKFTKKDKNKTFEIPFPKTGFFSKKNEYFLTFEAVDGSYWKFFAGNSAKKEVKITVDTKRPDIQIISNSYKITKGGVATVIFKAEDTNLKDVHVELKSGKKFQVTPFVKDGYYISLIAWPIDEKDFSAFVVVTDEAGNIAKDRIRYYLDPKAYKTSTIKLTDKFLADSVALLSEDLAYSETLNLPNIEKFKYINNKLRDNSVETLVSVTNNITYDGNFKLKAFAPLKNGAAIASYGDFRIYEYKGDIISETYHLGLDLASTKEADIILSNKGEVVFAGENSIYGKTVIVSHGLGVYSLYSHCSAIMVENGDQVLAGDIIAKTGRTGFVFGDHLHFGIIVQGVEVRPAEWMDTKWMQENVYSLIENAKKVANKY